MSKFDKKEKKKIMICAPSNSVVDTIAKKIVKEGILRIEGIVNPKIVRFGVFESKESCVSEISYERICEK